jgi:mannose-6-phosphate isomerase-like protein (cupin superfamily)
MSDYTITNLDDVNDSAAAAGLGFGVVRFPRTDVGAEQTGFVHQRYFPGARQSFGHRHHRAEEVCFVISGSGAVKLDDGVHELRTHDIVRLAPHVTRSFAAGEDGLELLVFGPHHPSDGEVIQGYWDAS